MTLLTSDQVARLAGCSVSYVQILRRAGVITAVSSPKSNGVIGGNAIDYRYDESVVPIIRASKESARNRQRTGGRSANPTEGRRYRCFDMGRDCVFTPADGNCPSCRAEHDINAYSGAGASSSWETLVIGGGR